MGGAQERVEIHLIAHPDEDQTEARRLLTEQFATFDAGKAHCLLAKDREHLLAVIEAGFGDFDNFNRVARSLLTSRLHDELSSRSSSLFHSESSHGNSLLPTQGYLEAGGQVCIVSFPASLGQKAWNGMVGGGQLNFACVWTGDTNSPTSEWYDPWVVNVDEAVKRGMTLLVYGHSNHPVENQFTHVSPLWGEQKYRLGAGQQAEVKHMNERGIRYKVFALGTGFVGTGFTGDALVKAASDGPIALIGLASIGGGGLGDGGEGGSGEGGGGKGGRGSDGSEGGGGEGGGGPGGDGDGDGSESDGGSEGGGGKRGGESGGGGDGGSGEGGVCEGGGGDGGG